MKTRSRAGFAFIELLLVLLTIVFLYYLISKFHLGKPLLNKEVEQTLVQQGINTTSYKTIVDSTKAKLADIQERQEENAKKLESMN